LILHSTLLPRHRSLLSWRELVPQCVKDVLGTGVKDVMGMNTLRRLPHSGPEGKKKEKNFLLCVSVSLW